MDTLTEVKTISVDLIQEPSLEARSYMLEDKLEELAESIKVHGIIQPLIVIHNDSKYEIVAGHRRYLAAKIAGLIEVPCIIQNYTPDQKELAKIQENIHREDLNPLDEAKMFLLLQNKFQYTVPQIAKTCAKSQTYVYTRLESLNYPDDIRDALYQDKIKISVAKELAQIDDKDIRKNYLNYAIQNGLTAEQSRKWKESYLVQRETYQKIADIVNKKKEELSQKENEIQEAIATEMAQGKTYKDAKEVVINRIVQAEMEQRKMKEEYERSLTTCFCCERKFPVWQLSPITCCQECFSFLYEKLHPQEDRQNERNITYHNSRPDYQNTNTDSGNQS